MLIEDRHGPATLRGFSDGVYLLTDAGSWPLRDHPALLDHLVRACAQHLGVGQGDAIPTAPAVGTLVGEPDGAVSFVADGEIHRLAEHRELAARLVTICRRALGTNYPADAWEVD